eukprot:Blabericola_migrator_1__8297@NODE_4307_length_1227_cov_146_273276_g2581_i1_p1_GENE_NODE_4307_length_1227_cov_146_273276_g2581_i1NODE_4307_length_1227_cov_146_273276_g2581_i1_p1_ORF_typecomplete_len377_score44_85_NODE_4307_length_1227_cov_146_273276_g2581_i1561186
MATSVQMATLHSDASDAAAPSLPLKDPAAFYVDPEGLSSLQWDKHEDIELTIESDDVDDDALNSSLSDEEIQSSDLVSNNLIGERSNLTHYVATRIVDDVFKERRRQVKVQSLEDIVILLAIPRYKSNGQLNHIWPSCHVVGWGEVKSMQKLLVDPITGDVIYGYSRRPSSTSAHANDEVSDALMNSLPEAHVQFYMKCACCDDEDRPAFDKFYSVPASSPGVYSLRDGVLCQGARVFDSGIILAFDFAADGNADPGFTPILHYFDEVFGVWARKPCTAVDGSRYLCVLPAARRTEFVVQVSHHGYIKTEHHLNFRVGWPGCYIVQNGAVMAFEYKTLLHNYIGGATRCVNGVDGESSVLQKTMPPQPATFSIGAT